MIYPYELVDYIIMAKLVFQVSFFFCKNHVCIGNNRKDILRFISILVLAIKIAFWKINSFKLIFSLKSY